MSDVSVETHTIITTKHTQYRLRPSPDTPLGYKGGACLEWRDLNDGDWQGYFFIEPKCIGDIACALHNAAADVAGD